MFRVGRRRQKNVLPQSFCGERRRPLMVEMVMRRTAEGEAVAYVHGT